MTKRVSVILLVVATMLLWCPVAGQEVYKLTAGAWSRGVDEELLHKGLYLGQYEGLHCWAGVVDGKDKSKQVVLVDGDLEVKARVTMPEGTEYCDLMAGTMVDGEVHIVMVDSAATGMTMVYSAGVDLGKMLEGEGVLQMAVLDSLSYGATDRCYVWAAVSPDGRHVGKIVVVEYPDRMQYSALAQLYDWRLERVWEKEYAVESLEHLCVTDEGVLVSLGYENDETETHFIYNIIGEHEANTFSANVECPPIRQLELAGVVGNRIMAVGLFATPGSRRHEYLCGGTVGLAFDIETASLSGMTMRPFQNEDMNVLLNKKTRVVQTTQELDLVSISGVTLTDYGAVIAVGRNWRADVVEDNGVPFHTHNRMGLHLVAYDTIGNPRWARNIRRNDIERDGEEMLTIGLMGRGDDVTVVKAEYLRIPVVYDVSRDAKPLIVGKKSNMAMYRIAANGAVSKQLLEEKVKQGLLRSVMRSDGTILLLTKDGKRVRSAEVKVEN